MCLARPVAGLMASFNHRRKRPTLAEVDMWRAIQVPSLARSACDVAAVATLLQPW